MSAINIFGSFLDDTGDGVMDGSGTEGKVDVDGVMEGCGTKSKLDKLLIALTLLEI